MPDNINLDSTSSATTSTVDATPVDAATMIVNTSTRAGEQGIRNIIQTSQEREVVKTCPDIIIYLDGKTYLINQYVSVNATQSNPDLSSYVPFNDHVQTFQANYDVDNLVPTGSILLVVPNHLKYLYQSPGGNNLITSMMEVQVYAKGYFASGTGNTVYHRIFKGVTTNVNHSDTGTVLQITVQCLGILRFLEAMYTDLAPAAVTNSPNPVTPYITNQEKMNPYLMLADIFNRPISMDQFLLTSVVQASLSGGPGGKLNNKEQDDWVGAVDAGYIHKWAAILDNLRKEVHILGYRMGDWEDLINGETILPRPDSKDKNATQHQSEGQGTLATEMLVTRSTVNPALSLVEQTFDSDYYVDAVRCYQPDLGMGNIDLTNGRITSRLERIKTILQMIGYEGYQDIDGTILFKPPLYNLDVTNIGTTIPTTNKTQIPTSVAIQADNNPFVVHLSEIESESETEDEQGIRATRVTTQTRVLPNSMASVDPFLRLAVTHIDIPKLVKFGVREEPARDIPWLKYQDKVAAYTYAVCELNRANRSWKTYNITIPLRPEIKLGFPIYFPHKDMYGYTKNVTITYQTGGAATMTISLDSLRKRPMFPATHDTGETEVRIYTTQPNLVMEWTSGTSTPTPNSTIIGYDYHNNPIYGSKPATMNGGSVSPNGPSVLLNNPATVSQSPDKPIYQEELEILGIRNNQWGASWGTKADTRTKSFRVQNDIAIDADTIIKGSDGTSRPTGIYADGKSPFFSAANWMTPRLAYDYLGNPVYKTGSTNQATTVGVNMVYLQKILTSQPYTDEGGYELMTPFPWGRWKTLKEALLETTLGVTKIDTIPTSQDTQVLAGTDVFLFAGVSSPQAIDPSNNLSTELNTSATSFELITPPPGTYPQNDALSDTQPDKQVLQSISDEASNRTNVFLSGGPAPSSQIVQVLSTVTPPSNKPQPTLSSVGVTPSSNQQNQTFISKLLNRNKSTSQ